MKALLAKINISDLPDGNLRDLAGLIGMGKLKELIVKRPGMILRIPKNFSKIYCTYCRRYIERNYNGSNHSKLAKSLGVSERTIYRHLNAKSPN